MDDSIWRADPPAGVSGPMHRFSEFFRDVPILAGGQALFFDDDQRNRLGRHVEACGLRKTAPRQIKYWAPPRGQQQAGNTGQWVPIHLPDPPEVTTPDPARMTAEEREFFRAQLDAYEALDHPERNNS
ncbi:phage gene 29 protein family protein [Gordonia sputi]|uniref:phage gene 29 protein family protein n=1 Tax=Gordonia sputi TaxID=36823 RepID=UPI0036CEE4E5